MMKKYSIGLDFGTESVRAVLVDLKNGETVASDVQKYADGVIETALPGGRKPLGPDWALQNPADWLSAMEATISAILRKRRSVAEAVAGIGIDFTSCTILPVNRNGTPLCTLAKFKDRQHAWVKLWKHHAAAPQAARISELAEKRREKWLPRYGGFISSEWVMPKALQMLEEDPAVYQEADLIIEGGDWIAWQLTGNLTRNTCAAGYKGTWSKADGFPGKEFLSAINANFKDLYRSKLSGEIMPPGAPAGGLTAVWAERLGLPAGLPVAVAIIDAHSGLLGAGIDGPGIMFMAMGTSTCHMLMSDHEVVVEGISGVVEDGILPGLFAYEAGQAGAGDIFGWFINHGVPPIYHREASSKKVTLHALLEQKAGRLSPGKSGLLALDWWNGNRSTLVDAELNGMLVGLTLATKAEEIYRALIEATAFGTRVIIEAFTGNNVAVDSIVAGGGLTRNALLMQIYADITGRSISVSGTAQACAQGAAMLGAVAAGASGGGYDRLSAAVRNMALPPATTYKPMRKHRAVYDELYAEYCRLYDYFGRGGNNVMKILRSLRHK
jgi:L-ribulokinase